MGSRWKSQNRKNVYLSPYVEEPLNSKVIKSFVPELRSRVFRVSRFLCSMYICYEHSNVRFTNRKNVYLSPYVEEPLNSKVIKSFVPELRSRVFRVSRFLCSMYICYEHSNVRFTNRKNVYLSPYVEEPLNSKVIKSFVPELRSCVFRVSRFLCSMYICYEHSTVRFTHSRIWLWYINI